MQKSLKFDVHSLRVQTNLKVVLGCAIIYLLVLRLPVVCQHVDDGHEPRDPDDR